MYRHLLSSAKISRVYINSSRNFSFFSDIFGYSPSKVKEKFSELKKPVQKKTEDTLPEKKLDTQKPATSSQKKYNVELPLEEEYIRGGGYPPRGVKNPPKRLREWQHTVENLTVGPRKLNLIAKLIRKLPVEEARLQLTYSKKAISRDVLLALDEACKQARIESNMHPKDLIVGQCYVGGKIIGKKIDIKGRGKSGIIKKRVSHLNVILYENPNLVDGFFSESLAHLTPERANQMPRRRIPMSVVRGVRSLERRGKNGRSSEEWDHIKKSRAALRKNETIKEITV